MTSKPRVFLADDNQTSFDFFRSLAESEGWVVAGYAADYDSFISRAPQSNADVMLVSTGFLAVMSEADRRALREVNHKRVLLGITDADDFAELKAAVRAGARDCVSANGPRDLIAAAVNEYIAEGPIEPVVRQAVAARGKVVAFCGADGGTGKSFLALQAAGMSALHAGARTCLVDFDLRCGALSVVVGTQAPGSRSLADLAEVIDEIRPFQIESLLREHNEGFSMICGPAPDIQSADTLLANLTETLRVMFDAIIIDFPPNHGAAFPPSAIDSFFIVMTPDAASTACGRRLSMEITAAREHADVTGIINRSDRTGALKAAEVRRLSGLEITAEVPEDEGAGRLFDSRGSVFASTNNLALVKGLVPAVQRIRHFEELAKPARFSFREWRPPWAAIRDA